MVYLKIFFLFGLIWFSKVKPKEEPLWNWSLLKINIINKKKKQQQKPKKYNFCFWFFFSNQIKAIRRELLTVSKKATPYEHYTDIQLYELWFSFM